jgi:hypothetical protein
MLLKINMWSESLKRGEEGYSMPRAHVKKKIHDVSGRRFAAN